MSNLTKIIKYGKDPSCVACITPIFGGAWYSSIRDQYQPRNFVPTKSFYWTDFASFFKSIGTNDFYFRLKFHINSYTRNSFLFQNGSSAQIYMGCWSYNRTSAHLTSTTKITNTPISASLIPDDSPDFLWEHVLEIERRNGTAKLIFDGVIKKSASGQTNIDCSLLDSATSPFYTSYDVSFSEIYIEDLDAGTSWSAPHDVLWQENPQPVLPPVAGDSIAQRLGLLTKYNCDTSQLDFRLASTGINNWYVKTGLNFAGWSRPLTIIGRMYIAPDNGGSDQYDYDTGVYHPLIQQGFPQSGVPSMYVITALYNNQYNGNRYRVHLSLSDGTDVRVPVAPVTPPQGRIITLATTIDPFIGRLSIYENGILLNSVNDARLIGFTLSTDTSSTYNDPVAYIHQRLDNWQNRNDRVDWLMVYDRVLNDAEIKYLSYDRANWIDLSLPVESGTINITTDSIPELEWTLPDGTKSTAATLNQTVEAGTLRMKCYKYGKTFRINASTALQNSTIKVKDLPRVTSTIYFHNLPGITGNVSELPRVTYYLYLNNLFGLTGNVSDLPRVTSTIHLNNLSGLTGNVSDLPRVTSTLFLHTLSGLTGNVSDLPRVTYYLNLYTLSGLTGNVSDLPLNTGSIRQIFNMSGIAGALPVVSTNTNVYYYDNAQVTPAEYDQTIQNIVDAGGVNGTLRISNTRTSASDANIATLQSRGWTVTEH